MIDVSMLSAPWRTVREVTAVGALVIPAGVRAVLRSAWSGEFNEVRIGSGSHALPTEWDAYLPLTKDGAGDLVTRQTTVTREWTEVPPNDETKVFVLFDDVAVYQFRGVRMQVPEPTAQAWMLRSEWEVFLRGPRVVHVPVTAEDISIGVAAGERYAEKVNARDKRGWDREFMNAVNPRLAERATVRIANASDPSRIYETLAAHLAAALASEVVP